MAAVKAYPESFEIVPNTKRKASILRYFGFAIENDGSVDQTRLACKFSLGRMVLK